jgi:hypothetical protein
MLPLDVWCLQHTPSQQTREKSSASHWSQHTSSTRARRRRRSSARVRSRTLEVTNMLRTHTSAINTLIVCKKLSRRVEHDIRALTLLAPSDLDPRTCMPLTLYSALPE